MSDAHATAYAGLPAGHADPFDLLLVATAKIERMSLITSDDALFKFAGTVGGVAVEKP